jgi:hypothetical protein
MFSIPPQWFALETIQEWKVLAIELAERRIVSGAPNEIAREDQDECNIVSRMALKVLLGNGQIMKV